MVTDPLEKLIRFRDEVKRFASLLAALRRPVTALDLQEKRAAAAELQDQLLEQHGALMPFLSSIPHVSTMVRRYDGVPFDVVTEALHTGLIEDARLEELRQAEQVLSRAIGLASTLPADHRIRASVPGRRAFLARSFRAADEPIVDVFRRLLRALRWEVIEGEPAQIGGVSQKVQDRIRSCTILVALLTAADRRSGGELVPSAWIIEEAAFAAGEGLQVVRLLEDGVTLEGGIHGDAEYVPFIRANPGDGLIKLVEMVGPGRA